MVSSKLKQNYLLCRIMDIIAAPLSLTYTRVCWT